MQGLIRFVYVEGLGVKVPTDPLQHLLMSWVLRVCQNLKETGVPWDPPNILRRASTLSSFDEGNDSIAF